MRSKFGMLAGAALLAGLSVPGHASAQTAYTTQFTTSITYQNVDEGDATINLVFYPEKNGTGINIPRPTLAKGAGTSIFAGNINEIGPSFKGTAVLLSDRQIVATMVQVPGGTVVKNRPLANGFSDNEGAAKTLIATVLKNKFGYTTQFSVQNVEADSAIDLTLRFYNADAPAAAPVVLTEGNVPANSAKYFDAGQLAQLADGFNGSVVIEAKRSGTANDGLAVAAAMELSVNSIGASAFEGVTGGANTVYLPSALCNAFGGASTAYAVQNTTVAGTPGAAIAQVTVTYSNGLQETKPIASGAKASFLGCTTLPANFSGSATITSIGAPIVAIGKVGGAGLSTAFVGATSGASKLALPYIRYTQTRFDPNPGNRQRAFIAIQNVGTPIPANGVSVKYLDKNGVVVGTHTIAAAVPTGGKVNSNPTNIGAAGDEFGNYPDGSFGGSAIVEGPAGSQLVAVVRIQSFLNANQTVGEDYSGIIIR